MSTRTEKVRKLRALARSPNRHEAALALAKAQELEGRTAKAIAQAIAQLLKARGMQVLVRRRVSRERWPNTKADAAVRYFSSRGRWLAPHRIQIDVIEYE